MLNWMMKCDQRWEVTNKCIYNEYILCSKTVDDLSPPGPYVAIFGYVLGRISCISAAKVICKYITVFSQQQKHLQ